MPPAESTKKSKLKVLTTETLAPIGVVSAIIIPIISTIIIATWTLRGVAVDIETRLTNIETTVGGYERNSWTYKMMKDFSEEAGYKNPNWKVPDFRKIKAENTDN